MRFLPSTAAGFVASALALAACNGQGSTAPNETPSFSKISPQTQYTATLSCNAAAAASRSSVVMTFQGVLTTNLNCNPATPKQATASSFTEFWWAIMLEDNTGLLVKECPRPRKGQVLGSSTRTGQFSCKDAKTGMSVVLTLEAS
jgi:hypothetical protein